MEVLWFRLLESGCQHRSRHHHLRMNARKGSFRMRDGRELRRSSRVYLILAAQVEVEGRVAANFPHWLSLLVWLQSRLALTPAKGLDGR